MNSSMDKNYAVPNNFRKSIGDKKISGTNITTKLTRLNKQKEAGELSSEDANALEWLEGMYKTEKGKIYNHKELKMKTGIENSFLDTHEKKGDPNPDKVGGLAKLTSSGEHTKQSDQIENNRVQYYESIESEIDEMRYLIEYMNNNKKNII